MANPLFVVGYCPSCGTGPLGVRLCGACGKPHVLCEECDAMWLTRDTTQPAIFPRQPEVPCAACGHSLRDGAAHWANWQELVGLNWHSHVVAQGTSWAADTSSQPSADPPSLRSVTVAPESLADTEKNDNGLSQGND